MQPVYEQIVCQIKGKIIQGELIEETLLPSVRTLAKEIKVSALTVKKAYDQLEAEGFVITVHGKGSYVASANQAQLLEEKKKEWRQSLSRRFARREAAAWRTARSAHCLRLCSRTLNPKGRRKGSADNDSTGQCSQTV